MDLHCSGTMITPAAISVPTDLKAPARGDLPVRRAKSSSGSKLVAEFRSDFSGADLIHPLVAVGRRH